MYLAKIYVTLKPTVNDPQGRTIERGLKGLGFESVKGVRAGKYLEIATYENNKVTAEKQINDMCNKLLANPIIEEYHFELVQTQESNSA
ncbi:MAG: phosphoribosylformylglycinamidine synthase [Chloroflexi bacterium]|jgi:phosphoribosylformylglycinamidine synthase|nr:MAG: phosphoribosylformylglycinamidine synthase [Chloroflexota bacterium]